MIKPLLLGMNRYHPLFWQSHRDHQKPDECRHVVKTNISVMDKKNIMIEFQNSGKHTVHTKNYRDFNWLVTPLIPLFALATCCCDFA